MITFLDFEKPIADLEARVAELRETASSGDLDIDPEIGRLEAKSAKLLRETYAKLSPWQKAQVARHPERPHFKDYVAALTDEFIPLAGDRAYAEDPAIVGGFARIDGRRVMLIGHEKGEDTEGRLKHNFGMANPEGYRKAVRIMDMADRFSVPVISFVDTAGAYPGIGAEERGQAEAIARSIEVCLDIQVPLISVIIGEGGSGGAIAIAAANRVLILEHSIYSVISPEGAASILWRDSNKAEDAAVALKITAADLQQLKVIDEIIPEPVGGAHRDRDKMMAAAGQAIAASLAMLKGLSPEETRRQRREKFLAIGRAL